MTAAIWNSMSIFEQLSNIAGEVERLISNKQGYDNGILNNNYTDFYLKKIVDLVYLTISDPKNSGRGRELLDEVYEIERYIMGDVDEEYIRRYWNQYTAALSQTVV